MRDGGIGQTRNRPTSEGIEEMREDLWYLDSETLEAIDRLGDEACWLVIQFEEETIAIPLLDIETAPDEPRLN